MMQFSEYVIVDSTPQSIDPLGFRRPSGALLDLIFPQFTVLTLHPAYLSALCCFLHYLEQNPPGAKASVAREVRSLELLWGVANASVDGRVININKFRDLCGSPLRLRSIEANHPLYRRLAYGTLGHYSSAAVRWKLVGKSGRELLQAGKELAQGFAQRRAGARSFMSQLSSWKQNQEFLPEEMADLGDVFGVGAPASASEKRVWGKQVDTWCKENRQTAVLWQRPLQDEALPSDATGVASYRLAFPKLRAYYPELDAQLTAIQQFERLGAATQFVFDLHWASLTYKKELAAQPGRAEQFAAAVGKLAKTYIHGGRYARDAGNLFSTIAEGTRSYESLRAKVVEHHKAHQRAKGTSPILDHDDLILRDGVDLDTVRKALDDAENADDVQCMMDGLQFRYRRQWHFEKCRRWHDWALTGTEYAS